MMAGPGTDRAAAPEGGGENSRIRSEIDASRVELASLRQEVASARLQLATGRAGTLQEANEYLVLAVLAAQRDAEASEARRLVEVPGLSHKDGGPAPVMAPDRQELLQEANTQLLLAALNAQQLREAAEKALREQTTFLGVVAHELRNPLTPIRNAASILGRIPSGGPLLSKVQGIIERQVQNMSRLVEDLLDVSRATTGKLRLEMASVDMTALVDEVAQSVRPAMESRQQLFEVHLPAQPALVKADAVRLTQVVCNLLDNASKYTPEGGHIRLDLAVHVSELVLTVVDNGIGITPQALAVIFEPFVQEQHATLFNGSGLGIGLTVARELVEGHGGRVDVRSGGQGQGSCFSVTLPLERPAPAPGPLSPGAETTAPTAMPPPPPAGPPPGPPGP